MNNMQILVCGRANSGKSSVMEIIKRALADAGINNIAISGYMNEDQSYIAQRTAAHLKDCIVGIDSVEIIEVMKDRPSTTFSTTIKVTNEADSLK